MRLLADIAEEAGVALQLHADPWGANPMMGDALQAWYGRFGFGFGFVARSGDLVPYWPERVGLAMWREPTSHALNPSLGPESTPSFNGRWPFHQPCPNKPGMEMDRHNQPATVKGLS
jgi:hypothetical protein